MESMGKKWFGQVLGANSFNWVRGTTVRALLGLANAFCLLSFRNGIARTYGRSAANWFVLLQASQFHVVFYASRTLPNSFAFGLSTSYLWREPPIPFSPKRPSISHAPLEKKKRDHNG